MKKWSEINSYLWGLDTPLPPSGNERLDHAREEARRAFESLVSTLAIREWRCVRKQRHPDPVTISNRQRDRLIG